MGEIWGCGTIEEYSPIGCNDTLHYNRVSGLAIFKKSNNKDLSLVAEWAKYVDGDPLADPVVPNTYTLSDDMIVVPGVKGTYDPGDPEVVEGYGDRLEVQKNRTHTLEVFFVYQKKNEAFYASLEFADNAGLAIFSGNRADGDLQVVQGVNASVVVKTGITELLGDYREGSIKFTWKTLKRPAYVDTTTQAIRDIFF